jgi:hypothetical protein
LKRKIAMLWSICGVVGLYTVAYIGCGIYFTLKPTAAIPGWLEKLFLPVDWLLGWLVRRP